MGQSLDRVSEIASMMRAVGVPQSVAIALEQVIRHHANPDALNGSSGHLVTMPQPSSLGVVAALFHRKALKRAELLGDLASDLAWQMLLALVAEDERGRGIAVSSLCEASGGPATTALRHIHAMISAGLVLKSADPRDGRRYWISLTNNTRERMREMLMDFCVPPPRAPAPHPPVFAE